MEGELLPAALAEAQRQSIEKLDGAGELHEAPFAPAVGQPESVTGLVTGHSYHAFVLPSLLVSHGIDTGLQTVHGCHGHPRTYEGFPEHVREHGQCEIRFGQPDAQRAGSTVPTEQIDQLGRVVLRPGRHSRPLGKRDGGRDPSDQTQDRPKVRAEHRGGYLLDRAQRDDFRGGGRVRPSEPGDGHCTYSSVFSP